MTATPRFCWMVKNAERKPPMVSPLRARADRREPCRRHQFNPWSAAAPRVRYVVEVIPFDFTIVGLRPARHLANV